ncbi:hypothetical protein MKS88_002145 [Plasmodium brasilianum]|uniref:Uncharacterized protein n=1 Tax=Plasmodium brasilianum TaxID=5824 RepID=A0ACB9YCI9_PLABR|nr:hypothetical protein MKS88_002145 [Plasmodium brasilianum]
MAQFNKSFSLENSRRSIGNERNNKRASLVKSNNNYKNVIVHFAKFISVCAIIWSVRKSPETNNSDVNETSIGNIISEHGLNIPHGRIIAEQEPNNNDTWKHDFVLTLKDEENEEDKELHSEDKNDPEYMEKLNRLCGSTSETWKQTVREMEEEFYIVTKDMDESWKNDMWNKEWAKYLRKVHAYITLDLNESSLSLNDKEHIVNIWLTWARKDFEFFLQYVTETWEDYDEELLQINRSGSNRSSNRSGSNRSSNRSGSYSSSNRSGSYSSNRSGSYSSNRSGSYSSSGDWENNLIKYFVLGFFKNCILKI